MDRSCASVSKRARWGGWDGQQHGAGGKRSPSVQHPADAYLALSKRLLLG